MNLARLIVPDGSVVRKVQFSFVLISGVSWYFFSKISLLTTFDTCHCVTNPPVPFAGTTGGAGGLPCLGVYWKFAKCTGKPPEINANFPAFHSCFSSVTLINGFSISSI